MKFAIINDMHVSSVDTGYENGVQRKLVGESERLIKSFIKEMNSTERPEFVVNLGDLIEDVGDKKGDTFYFKHAISLMSKLKMPVYYLIGNHDVKTLNEAEIAKLVGYKKMYYSFDNGEFHFIALGFGRDHAGDPVLPDEQLAWLEGDLAKANKPTVIFSHYGLADDDMKGNFWFEEIPHRAVLKNRGKIRRIIEESQKVRAVISAHQHWNRVFVYNHIPYITVTSLVENFNNDGVPAEAYTLVNLDSDKISVEVKGNDPANYNFEFIN